MVSGRSWICDFLFLLGALFLVSSVGGQERPVEGDYYQLETFPIPEGLKLEASGLAVLPDGRLAIAVRHRGRSP